MRFLFVGAVVASTVFFLISRFYSEVLADHIQETHQETAAFLAKKVDQEIEFQKDRFVKMARAAMVTPTKKGHALRERIDADPNIVSFSAIKWQKKTRRQITVHHFVHRLAQLEFAIDANSWAQQMSSQRYYKRNRILFFHGMPNLNSEVFTMTLEREDKRADVWEFRIDLRKGAFNELFSGRHGTEAFLVDREARLLLHSNPEKNLAAGNMGGHPLVKKALQDLRNRSPNRKRPKEKGLWSSHHHLGAAPFILVVTSSRNFVDQALRRARELALLGGVAAMFVCLALIALFAPLPAPERRAPIARPEALPLLQLGDEQTVAVDASKSWYLVQLANERPQGPYDLQGLAQMLEEEEISYGNSYVFRMGDLQMTPVYQIQGLNRRAKDSSEPDKEEEPEEEVCEPDMYSLVGSDGSLQGDYTVEDLEKMLRQRRVSATGVAWHKNTSSWVFIRNIVSSEEESA